MPGVYVTSAVQAGPTGTTDIPHSQLFLIGWAERGPVDKPTLLRSMTDYVHYYGDYAAGNMWIHAKTYFEEGGSRLYFQRVAVAAATVGDKDLDDSQSTPSPTIKVAAVGPGAWSSDLAVAVTNPGTSANTFTMSFYHNDVLLLTTRDLTSVTDAINYCNTHDAIKHLFVLSDLTSTATATYEDHPVTLAKTSLDAGTADTGPIEAEIITGLGLMGYQYGSGAVASPGQYDATWWAALIDHCVANNRIAICSFDPADDTVAEAITAIATMSAETDPEYAAYYFPHVKVPDPATSGIELTIPPDAYVAGARAKAIAEAGPWRAAAGIISSAAFVSDVQTAVTRANGDSLDEKKINAIRQIGTEYRIYGARSSSTDEDNWRFITYRDTINYIVGAAEARLEDLVFETIDSRGTLFAKIEATLTALLDPLRVRGGLYEAYDSDGNLVDPGYSVDVSSEINPTSELALGRVHARIGVRVAATGDQILLTVTKSGLTDSLA